MTQAELLTAARIQGIKNPKDGVIFLTEFHERIVLPVGCFILTLLGLPLGLQAGPGRRGIGIPMGLGFFILYYVLTTIGSILSEDLAIPVVIGMWSPCVILGYLAYVMIKRVDQEKPLVSPWLMNKTFDLWDRYLQPVFKLAKAIWYRLLRVRLKRKAFISISPTNMEIHANAVRKVYHYPGCDFYDCKNCTIHFINSKIAEDAGFTPCPFCSK